jgi:uncharacterized protein
VDKHGVVHFEIYADDPDKLADFYKGMFGWEIQSMPNMDYRFVKTVATNQQGMPTNPGGINGGLMKRPMPEAKFWVNYVNVDSVDESARKAEQMGAKINRPKTAVPGMGWFAIVSDPQGNPFGLWQTDPQAR